MHRLFLIGKALSNYVDIILAAWRLPPLAAALNIETASYSKRKNGGFDFSKAAVKEKVRGDTLLYDGFFSFAVVRQISIYDLMFIKGDVSLSKSKECMNNERLNCNHNHK